MEIDKFGEIEFKMLEILKIDGIKEDEFWAAVQSYSSRGRESSSAGATTALHRMWMSINNSKSILLSFIELLRKDTRPGAVTKAGRGTATATRDQISQVTVILPEAEGRLSNPRRLIMLMEAMEGLYEAAATLENLPPSGLGVAACDSGSDKSFDFTGVSRIIEALRSVLMEAWQSVIYWREKQLETSKNRVFWAG